MSRTNPDNLAQLGRDVPQPDSPDEARLEKVPGTAMASPNQAIRERALGLGFDAVGFAPRHGQRLEHCSP